MAEKYLKLLRKGGYYRGLNQKAKLLDPVAHRYVYPPNEIRYLNQSFSGRRIRETLSIYLKYAQMRERDNVYSTEEMDLAKGQIRFELRISSDKILYFMKKYACMDSDDFINHTSELGERVLAGYLSGLYGTGRFVRFSEAMEIIGKSNHQRKIKRTMERIVERTRKEDMAAAFADMTSGEKSRFRNYFNDLGISPVTFPDSWKESNFENPIIYIMVNNVNER